MHEEEDKDCGKLQYLIFEENRKYIFEKPIES